MEPENLLGTNHIANSNRLRKPRAIVKKHSGPLEATLVELNEIPKLIADSNAFKYDTESVQTTNGNNKENAYSGKSTGSTGNILKNKNNSLTPATTRRATVKEKKRERWLLTRKTWKYMTDAGRKLIPENVQNRKEEDLTLIEAHYQQLCASEPRFILWRRKSSYPGALRNSKHRLKHLLQHTVHKPQQNVELLKCEQSDNIDMTINLLQSYLSLDEPFKTTALLGSKTVRPDLTISPSSQRPLANKTIQFSSSHIVNNVNCKKSRQFDTLLSKEEKCNDLSVEVEQLLLNLKALSENAVLQTMNIHPEQITPSFLNDKSMLKQIYSSLKKQQLHRILIKHSDIPINLRIKPLIQKNLKHSTSLSSLFNSAYFPISNKSEVLNGSKIKNQNPNKLISASEKQKNISNKEASFFQTNNCPEKSFNSKDDKPVDSKILFKDMSTVSTQSKKINPCGSQTNFIQLHEIKQIAMDYKERKESEENALKSLIIDPDTHVINALSSNCEIGQHRRKTSIDNEDVSQSVSDTIKRYLRMARKKSVHDDNANRFKRVNYDRNLRNIRPRDNHDLPGIDCGNNKAVQTLDAWALISLNGIRGLDNSELLKSSHEDWEKQLHERIENKRKYDERVYSTIADTKGSDVEIENGYYSKALYNCSSVPNIPSSQQYNTETPKSKHHNINNSNNNNNCSSGGILHTGSQFLFNLWHGHHEISNENNVQLNPCQIDKPCNDITSNTKIIMQKSKSSSNVGHFVSKKIFKSRSRSQTRSFGKLTSKHETHSIWSPSENYTWTSNNGEKIIICDTNLQFLTEMEYKILQRVAIEKINELNVGIALETDLKKNNKTHRRNMVIKRRALTTTLFDIGKKDNNNNSTNIFGSSLESCIVNDSKLKLCNRNSRNSITSLFRISANSLISSGAECNKFHENVRSCESLPSSNVQYGQENYGNLKNMKLGQMSRSQIDMRRQSQEFDIGFDFTNSGTYDETEIDSNNIHVQNSHQLQIPNFVKLCIKYLEEHGLDKVGLFRVSTSRKRVKQMRDDVNKNFMSAFKENICPHDIATLLKEFLRDLPEPLLCSHLYKPFLDSQRIRNRRLQLEAISHLVKLLPVVHRDTLYVLLKFLANVASHSDDVYNNNGNVDVIGNKMDSNNLATVFAPNILRTKSYQNIRNNNYDAESMNDAINVVRIMINHYEEIYTVSAELLDIVYSHMLEICPDQLYVLCEQRYNLNKNRDDVFSTTSMSSMEKNNKKFYLRKSVMHNNDASSVSEITHNGLNPSNRNLKNNSNEDCNRIDRRKSSPNVVAKSGIVSAKIQISVPIQKQQQEDKNILNQKDDLNIPISTCIADKNSKQESFLNTDIPFVPNTYFDNRIEILNEGAPVSGCLSLISNINSANIEQKVSSTMNQSHNNESVTSFIKTKGGKEITEKSKERNLEPKTSTSITNIGGDILRSKKADFERVLLPVEQQQQQDQLRMNYSKNTVPSKSFSQSKIYKRQELIGSVQQKNIKK